MTNDTTCTRTRRALGLLIGAVICATPLHLLRPRRRRPAPTNRWEDFPRRRPRRSRRSRTHSQTHSVGPTHPAPATCARTSSTAAFPWELQSIDGPRLELRYRAGACSGKPFSARPGILEKPERVTMASSRVTRPARAPDSSASTGCT